MAKRHELTDDQWALIADLFPAQGRGGRWSDHRTAINGILWRLRTGAPWRDLPEGYGPWQTVYHRFNALRLSGLLGRLLERLQARLNAAGLIDPGLFCIDGTVIRAARAAAGASKKSGPASPRTTPWAGRAAASAPRFTWSATAGAPRWPRCSRRGNGTRARNWSGPWARSSSAGVAAGRGAVR